MESLMSSIERKYLKNIFYWLCLGSAFALVSLALFNEYRFSFNSDGAIKTVLARLALSEGRLIPHNWIYVNGDIFLASPQLFSIIIFPWLGLSYLSNAVADWLAYLYFLLLIYGTCRIIGPDCKRAAIVSTAIAASGLSAANFEFLIGGGAYSIYTGLALGLFALASRPLLDIRTREAILSILLTAAAAGLLCASNPTRGWVTVVIPLAVGWLTALFTSSETSLGDRIKHMRNPVVYGIIGGATVGTFLYSHWLLPSVFNYNAAAQVGFATKSEMLHHLKMLPGAWFDYFLVSSAWTFLSPGLRLLQCLVWAIATASLIAPLWVIFTAKVQAKSLVTFAWIVLAGFGVSFSALIVSSQLFQSIQEIRYALFPIFGSICIAVTLVDRGLVRHLGGRTFVLVLTCLVAVSISTVWRSAWHPGRTDFCRSYDERMALIDALKSDHVGTVLSTYWCSHVLTVLSSGAVEAYPVGINDAVRPFAHNMPKALFYGPGGSKQAVVLADDEASQKAWSLVNDQLGSPQEKIRSGPFEAWIYDIDVTKSVLGIGVEANDAIAADDVSVQLSRVDFPRCRSSDPCKYILIAKNSGRHVLATAGSKPLRLGIRGIDQKGMVIDQDQDIGRIDFPMPINPNTSEGIRVQLPVLSDPHASGYRVCLMQEGVAWHCDRTTQSSK